jgi:hypothetical protein
LTPCGQLTTQNGCGTQRGCAWASTSNTCTGIVTPCYEIGNRLECQLQQGCIWQ